MLNKKGLIALLALLPALAQADAVEGLLEGYREQGAEAFSAVAGATQWRQPYRAKEGQGERSCTTCHGTDLTQTGKHAKTGKRIEPLAPSVNPQRLSDRAKIEKWFKRNCKWTLGRACTPQEKGDFLSFLRQQ
jgi:cytochrome c553